jgi:N-acetylneuraminate lyase
MFYRSRCSGLVALSFFIVHAESKPYGAFDPVFTPFRRDENQTLATEIIPAYAAFTTAAGTDTIILGGSTGEWPSLSSAERIIELRAWRKALDDIARRGEIQPPKLMFNAGDVNLHRSQDLARAAVKYGADAVLVLPPCIMKPGTLSMLVKVVGMVAAAALPLPVWYYHYPKLYNVDFTMTDFLGALVQNATAMPNFKGVKFISSDGSDLANITALDNGRFDIINVHGEIESMAVGRRGSIEYTGQVPFLNNLIAAYKRAGGNSSAPAVVAANDRCSTFYKVLKANGNKGAARASTQFLPAASEFNSSELNLTGFDLGAPRLPLADISAEQLAGLKRDLIAGGFISG